jgi:hypothetical protein
MRVLFSFLLFLPVFLSSAHAAEPASLAPASALLQLGGTAAVFDSAAVRRALADPGALTGPGAEARRKALLAQAGLRPWQPPHVWVLQAGAQPGQWKNLAPALTAGAARRGFALVSAAPLPEAAAAFALLAPDRNNPGLGGLLAAYGADALVLVRDGQWMLWAPGLSRGGVLPDDVAGLPDVLAETLAALQQWPQAEGQAVVQVDNVRTLSDFTAVEAALGALPGAAPVRLIRAAPGRVWFALATPATPGLAAALDLDPHLPAALPGYELLPPPVMRARQLACPFLARRWNPESPAPDAPAPSPAVTPGQG